MYLHNDDGIAYGWAAIMIVLLISAAYYLAMLAVENQTIEPINKDITSGRMSQQTRNALQYQRDWLEYGFVVMVILSALVFGVVRAIARKT
jgi:hypothetical protein